MQTSKTCGFAPEHLFFTPAFDRALALNGAMVGIAMETMDVARTSRADLDLLRTASLAELVEAVRLAEVYNGRPQTTPYREITVVVDDRLVAAIYAFLHYAVPPYHDPDARDEPVVRMAVGDHVHFIVRGSRPARSIQEAA
jgi:hypothetical protein